MKPHTRLTDVLFNLSYLLYLLRTTINSKGINTIHIIPIGRITDNE